MEFLALEGILNKTLDVGGHVANDFPDVRARAVNTLGLVGTEDAKKRVLKVMLKEKEPNVQYEALHALLKIGIKNDKNALDICTRVFNEFHIIAPDNRMAQALLELFTSFLDGGGDIDDLTFIKTVMNIADGPAYTRFVRLKAGSLLTRLLGGS